MDAHDEDLFVVGPVEDTDPAALGHAFDVAPQEVVGKLFARRLLEWEYLAALRIDARHDVLDRAVLAGCVHRLENEQQRPGVLGVEHALLFREPLGPTLEEFGRLALVELQAAGIARVEILQSETLALGDPERIDVLFDAVEDIPPRHGIALPCALRLYAGGPRKIPSGEAKLGNR
jgi:hypothetical protein